MVQQIRRSSEHWPAQLKIIFVSKASLEQSQLFFERYWPQARYLEDNTGEISARYRVPRARFWQLFGWKTWLAGLRAFLRGHFIGRPTQDPWQMEAYRLVVDGEVVWKFDPPYAGQLPDWKSMLSRLPE